jgi:hypothetical protein
MHHLRLVSKPIRILVVISDSSDFNALVLLHAEQKRNGEIQLLSPCFTIKAASIIIRLAAHFHRLQGACRQTNISWNICRPEQ